MTHAALTHTHLHTQHAHAYIHNAHTRPCPHTNGDTPCLQAAHTVPCAHAHRCTPGAHCDNPAHAGTRPHGAALLWAAAALTSAFPQGEGPSPKLLRQQPSGSVCTARATPRASGTEASVPDTRVSHPLLAGSGGPAGRRGEDQPALLPALRNQEMTISWKKLLHRCFPLSLSSCWSSCTSFPAATTCLSGHSGPVGAVLAAIREEAGGLGLPSFVQTRAPGGGRQGPPFCHPRLAAIPFQLQLPLGHTALPPSVWGARSPKVTR